MEDRYTMKKTLISICGISLLWGYMCVNIITKMQQKIVREKKHTELNYVLYRTMNLWLMLMQSGKSIEDFFLEHHYFNIAIYGMGNMGERLYDALDGTNIHVRYGIDKKKENIYTVLPLRTPDEELEKVDVIVVTAVYYFNEIKQELCNKVDCPVISVEEIIEKVMRM